MATLYDLAMQYLNQSLPKTFKYDRTNPPTIGPRLPVQPEDPNAPVKRILPVQGSGGDGFSVYNPDPNSISNKNYSPYAYNKAMRNTNDFGQTVGPNPDLYYSTPLKGIPGAIQNYAKNSFLGKGLDALGNMLPVNKTAILQNELLGSGFRLNDIGQIVSDGGDYDTAGNVMSGYNTSKMTEKTFDDRIASLGNMTPEGRAKRTAAILEAKQNFIDAKNKTKTVFDDKSLAKDPDYKSTQQLIDLGIQAADDDSEDDMLDYTNPNIYNTDSIYTQTAPTYITDPYVSGQDDKDIGTTPPGTSDDGYVTDYYGGDPVIDAGGTAPGGGYATDYYGGDPVTDAGGTAPGGGYATDYYGGDSVTDAGGTAPGGGYATDYYGGGNDTGGGSTPDYSDVKTGGPPSQGGGGGGPPSQGGTHCCTAANERGDMTLTEVKKLRAWHRKQSKIWQKGYDVWGKVIADNLVAKSKWQSDRVRDFYNHKIYKKRTIGSIYADIVIYPMSIIIGSILTVMPPILGYQENKRHGKSSS